MAAKDLAIEEPGWRADPVELKDVFDDEASVFGGLTQ